MKSEHISDALNWLSDEMLEETDQARTRKKSKPWRNWAIAACLCAAVLGAAVLPANTPFAPTSPAVRGEKAVPDRNAKGTWEPVELAPDGLPLLYASMESGGMGFEGLLYYDFSEMENGNPWREDMELETLPVFRNKAYHPSGALVGLGVEEMEARAETVAEALGLEIQYVEHQLFGANRDSCILRDQIVSVYAFADGVKIESEADGCITVRFDGGLPLPEEYRFDFCNLSDQEADAVLDYLIDRFAALLNFQQPQKALFRDYNIDEDLVLDYCVYDAAGDDVADILNYSFCRADFAPDGEGKMMLIRLYDALACTEKIGDYPLISLEEAREALLAGRYITTVPYDILGEEYVYGGELVYRGWHSEQNFIPYYRFYVDVSHEFPNWSNSLKNYGAYYVPAVQPQYLKPGWEWDGSFN